MQFALQQPFDGPQPGAIGMVQFQQQRQFSLQLRPIKGVAALGQLPGIAAFRESARGCRPAE